MVFYYFTQILAFNLSMESIRVLGGRVVAPNMNILNIFNCCSSLFCNNAYCTVLIKSSQGCEVLLWDRRCEMGAYQSISVSWVTHYKNFHCLFGYLVY